MALQLVPFHFAMLSALTPPADVHDPPAIRAGPLPSSKPASAYTPKPVPREDQLDPFHFATPLPPAYSADPLPSSKTANARTWSFGPPGNADHELPFQRAIAGACVP